MERSHFRLISNQPNTKTEKPSRIIIEGLIGKLESKKLQLSDLTNGQRKLLISFYHGCYGSDILRNETIFLRNAIAKILNTEKNIDKYQEQIDPLPNNVIKFQKGNKSQN